MLDSVIVAGVVALLILILQASVAYFKTEVGQMWLKLLMFVMTGVLNVLNGIAFDEAAITTAIILGYFKDGLILGAAASGIYGMGKDLSESTTNASALKMKGTSVIPARKKSLTVIEIGIIAIVLAIPVPIVGVIGLLLIASGYFAATVSATKYVHKKTQEDLSHL